MAYIAVIHISEPVEAKVATKHNVVAFEVREAFVLTRLEDEEREQDENGVERLLGTGTTADGRRIKAVLYPADESDGTWWLATAMWA